MGLSYEAEPYLSVVCIPGMAIVTYEFYRRRKQWPIQDRSPWLILIISMCMILWYLVALVSGFIGLTIMSFEDLPCLWVEIFCNILLIPTMLLIFIFRAFSLLVKFELTADLSHGRIAYMGANGGAAGMMASLMAGGHSNSNGQQHSSENPSKLPSSAVQYMMNGDGTDTAARAIAASPPPNNAMLSIRAKDVNTKLAAPLVGPLTSSSPPLSPAMTAPLVAATVAVTIAPATITASPWLQPSWYTRHVRYIRPRFLLRIFMACMAVLFTIFIIFAVTGGNSSCGQQNTMIRAAQQNLTAAIAAVELFILAILAYRLSKHGADEMRIKVEMIWTLASGLITAFIVFPIFAFVVDDVNGQHVAVDLLATFIWGWALIYPLYLAWRQRRRQYDLARQVASVESLAELMLIPEAAAQFATSFQRSYGHNNGTTTTAAVGGKHSPSLSPLIAARRTSTIKDGPTSPQKTDKPVKPVVAALRQAHEIYDSFIMAGSPFEINIGSRTRSSIYTTLCTFTPAVAAATRERHRSIEADQLLLQSIGALFNDAINEVLGLLEKNSFARWRLSSSYRLLLASLQHSDTGSTGTNGHAAAADGAIFDSPMSRASEAAADMMVHSLHTANNNNNDVPLSLIALPPTKDANRHHHQHHSHGGPAAAATGGGMGSVFRAGSPPLSGTSVSKELKSALVGTTTGMHHDLKPRTSSNSLASPSPPAAATSATTTTAAGVSGVTVRTMVSSSSIGGSPTGVHRASSAWMHDTINLPVPSTSAASIPSTSPRVAPSPSLPFVQGSMNNNHVSAPLSSSSLPATLASSSS